MNGPFDYYVSGIENTEKRTKPVFEIYGSKRQILLKNSPDIFIDMR